MKKVGILTFQDADNYGAMLQCYALQKKIEGMGNKCLVINYKCDYLSKPFSIAALKRKGMVRYILGNINAIVRKPRKKKFHEFRHTIPMTERVKKQDLKALNDEFDIFIVGSDCVWNDDITNFDTTYLLDFVYDSRKKNSYAASFGFSKMKMNMKAGYSKYLKEFNSLNVRELSGKEILNKIGVNAAVVLDPTLLLDSSEWDNVTVDLKINEKYIFVYQLTPSKYLLKIVRQLQRKTGYKVVIIPFPVGGSLKADSHLNYGPEEWVTLIRNAEYVVTDSFHGTAFSIIYGRKVYCCVNELATRIISLLELLGLNECLYSNNREFELMEVINYDEAYLKLRKEKEKSLKILKGIIHDGK